MLHICINIFKVNSHLHQSAFLIIFFFCLKKVHVKFALQLSKNKARKVLVFSVDFCNKEQYWMLRNTWFQNWTVHNVPTFVWVFLFYFDTLLIYLETLYFKTQASVCETHAYLSYSSLYGRMAKLRISSHNPKLIFNSQPSIKCRHATLIGTWLIIFS